MKGKFKTFFFLPIRSITLIAAGSWIDGMQGAIVAFFVLLLRRIRSWMEHGTVPLILNAGNTGPPMRMQVGVPGVTRLGGHRVGSPPCYCLMSSTQISGISLQQVK
jgi:hypothetical protein